MVTPGDLLAHQNKRHYTKKEAKIILKRLRAKQKTYKVRSIYKCSVCGLWCLTSIRKEDQYNLEEILKLKSHRQE